MGHEPKIRPVIILAAQQKLPELAWIRALAKRAQPVVVLDGIDGDAGALERAGAYVVRHSVPLGIGRCMKSGINACLLQWPGCPGALLVGTELEFPLEWIKPMLQAMRESPMTLSLGIAPLTADTPKRQARDCRWAARLFSLINGTRLADVRPALRAAPAALLPRLAVAGGHGVPLRRHGHGHTAGRAFALCDRSSAAKADPLVFHGVDVGAVFAFIAGFLWR